MLQLFINLFMLLSIPDLTLVKEDYEVPQPAIHTNIDSIYCYQKTSFFGKKQLSMKSYFDSLGRISEEYRLIRGSMQLKYIYSYYSDDTSNFEFKYDAVNYRFASICIFKDTSTLLIKYAEDSYDTIIYNFSSNNVSIEIISEYYNGVFKYYYDDDHLYASTSNLNYIFKSVYDIYTYSTNKKGLTISKVQKKGEMFKALEVQKYDYNKKKQLVRKQVYNISKDKLKLDLKSDIKFYYYENPLNIQSYKLKEYSDEGVVVQKFIDKGNKKYFCRKNKRTNDKVRFFTKVLIFEKH
jgi:hypothetical protein